MADRQSFITGNAQIVADCCDGMRDGKSVVVVVSGITLEGDVVSIRRVDDGDFQITLLPLSDDSGLVRLSASEGACYAYPGEDQALLRQAFCDGAVYTRTGKLPD